MRINGYEIPYELLYTKEHEWVKKLTEERAVVGVTDYAAKTLSDVVYVSLPQVGGELKQMTVMGSVESIKAVSDVYSPLSGKVLKVNEELSMKPELVNQSPYEKGWLIEVSPMDFYGESKSLMSAEDYAFFVKELITKKK